MRPSLAIVAFLASAAFAQVEQMTDRHHERAYETKAALPAPTIDVEYRVILTTEPRVQGYGTFRGGTIVYWNLLKEENGIIVNRKLDLRAEREKLERLSKKSPEESARRDSIIRELKELDDRAFHIEENPGAYQKFRISIRLKEIYPGFYKVLLFDIPENFVYDYQRLEKFDVASANRLLGDKGSLTVVQNGAIVYMTKEGGKPRFHSLVPPPEPPAKLKTGVNVIDKKKVDNAVQEGLRAVDPK